MSEITARKVEVDGDNLSIHNLFQSFSLKRNDITGFKVRRIPSLFDEIGIEIQASRTFLVAERAAGFFDLANFLGLEENFGPMWYRDAEDGRQLEM
jgi:hypothetical protein